MVFSSCKEFVFPAWQRCATQVACDIVGSSLIEDSLCGSASGVFGVPTDICDSRVKQKMSLCCSDLGLIVKHKMCQD